jgi:hypothetical membrane protein
MQILSDVHGIFFNAILVFSGILGVWAVVMAARNQSISGDFWGAVATLAGLSLVTILVGVVLALQGFAPVDGRTNIYFIYMAWLVIIMPGMFTQLRGRDDASAAIAFAMLAIFNLFVGLSMQSRGLVGPWVPVS